MNKPFDCISDFIFFEDKLEKVDIILVPGTLRPQLMKKAVELYQQGLAPLILPSGGVGPKLVREIKESKWKSEWEFMQSIGLLGGVPKNVILKEDKALHTFDNALLSRKVIKEKNIKIKKAIIVCKAVHARRALLTYQVAFSPEIEYIVCPVIDNRNIRKDNWFLDEKKIKLVMSEVEKIGKYFAKHITILNEEKYAK